MNLDYTSIPPKREFKIRVKFGKPKKGDPLKYEENNVKDLVLMVRASKGVELAKKALESSKGEWPTELSYTTKKGTVVDMEMILEALTGMNRAMKKKVEGDLYRMEFGKDYEEPKKVEDLK